MSYKDIKELEAFREDEKRAIYKRVEAKLFKRDKLFLFLHIIRGFFPGLAILAFLEAYFRVTVLREHSLLTGVALGVVSVLVWLWVENYKARRVAEVVPEVLEENRVDPVS